jgi:hypothetical protein
VKIKIVLEFDVREYEREAYDDGHIYVSAHEHYSIGEAPPAVLVDFLVDALGAEEDMIHDYVRVVSVTRGNEEIAVENGKVKE